jgi:uncharacterized protein YecT (DUF1311 family)
MVDAIEMSLTSRNRRMTRLQQVAATLLVCAVVSLSACQRGSDAAGSVNASGSDLQAAVVGARTSTRLHASTAQTKEPAPGDQFVVLDITVRNPDTQPHVFSEGKLIDVSAGKERAFATPVDMLADEFLTLQVLPPSARVHGKIAYEVPKDLTGVLYWQPGDASQRIQLHLDSATTAAAHPQAHIPKVMMPRAQANTPAIATTTRPIRSVSPIKPVAGDSEALRSGRGSVVTSSTQTTATIRSDTVATSDEPARSLACQALVQRNDPAEKARYIGFFRRECNGDALPSAWSAPQVATISAGAGAPTWPPRPGPAFDCSQAWTRAEHLICEDAVLSLMDWELNRAFAKARSSVADPDALQRDEDEWRHRVRDACDTTRCIESVYNQRTAALEAIGQPQ